MSSCWGLEHLHRKPETIVVFSSEAKLSDWVRDGHCRIKIGYKEALRRFKYNQRYTSMFMKENMDKEEVVFDEMDELRKQYLKKRAYQLENYIQ